MALRRQQAQEENEARELQLMYNINKTPFNPPLPEVATSNMYLKNHSSASNSPTGSLLVTSSVKSPAESSEEIISAEKTEHVDEFEAKPSIVSISGSESGLLKTLKKNFYVTFFIDCTQNIFFNAMFKS